MLQYEAAKFDNRGTITYDNRGTSYFNEANFMTNMVTRILLDALEALSLMIMMSISFLDTPHQGHGDPPFNQISE